MNGEEKFKLGRQKERRLWLAKVRELVEIESKHRAEYAAFAAMLLHNVMVESQDF